MKKFLVLYKASAEDFKKMMASATPEMQKAGMDAWMAWSQRAASSIVDMGAPLQMRGHRLFSARLREILDQTRQFTVRRQIQPQRATAGGFNFIAEARGHGINHTTFNTGLSDHELPHAAHHGAGR